MAFSIVSETELAYAAGILDGEGNIAIRLRHNQHGVKYHSLVVTVGSTDLVLIDWMHERFGGTKRINQRGEQKPQHKQLHVWQVNTLEAETFLAAVRPYLVIKGEQARLGLALRARIGAAGVRLEPGEHEARDELRLQLRALTKRGV